MPRSSATPSLLDLAVCRWYTFTHLVEEGQSGVKLVLEGNNANAICWEGVKIVYQELKHGYKKKSQGLMHPRLMPPSRLKLIWELQNILHGQLV